jgi:hypothetical protein
MTPPPWVIGVSPYVGDAYTIRERGSVVDVYTTVYGVCRRGVYVRAKATASGMGAEEEEEDC